MTIHALPDPRACPIGDTLPAGLREVPPMRQILIVLALLTFPSLAAVVRRGDAQPEGSPAPPRVEYVVTLDEPQTQLVRVTLRLRGPREPEVDVMLPVWRPGRYAINDHAGAVQDVHATDGGANPLPMRKIDKSTWRIARGDADEVIVSYRVYCNEARLRTRHVDATHAFLSPSAVMMYHPPFRDESLTVRIEAPEHWRIACGLDPDPADPRTLRAPNYDVLVDSPIEVGEHDLIEFDVEGVPHEIAIWGRGDWRDRPLAEDFGTIVRAQTAIFERVPYERYVFLIHCQPGFGGGTEHLNSTIMGARPESFEDDDAYQGFLGLVSHEFFHTWNVKQLRPAGIVPYDYQRENYTDLLWFAEGTTSYYDDLTLARTGLIDLDEYLSRLAGQIASVRGTPGRRVQSLSESSFDAWIMFNKRHDHSHNQSVNFYSQGALASLLLDMGLRAGTDNAVTLDLVMREMDRRFPLDAGGFTTDDLVRTISDLCGHDYQPFFDRYVRGTAEYPLEEALEHVGLRLARDADDEVGPRATLGIALRDADALAEVSRVDADGPAFIAGLNVGDRVVALDGVALRAGDLDDRLEACSPGESVLVTFLRHDVLHELAVELGERPAGAWKVERMDDATDAQRAAFEAWLGQPWDEGDGESETGEGVDGSDSP